MAEPEILIDTESIRLLYHPDGKIVHHELRRFAFEPALRAMMMERPRQPRRVGVLALDPDWSAANVRERIEFCA